MSTKKGIKTVVFAGATVLAIFSLTACSSNKSSNSGNGSNKNATTASSAKTVAKLPTDTGDDLTDLMNTAKNQGFTNITKTSDASFSFTANSDTANNVQDVFTYDSISNGWNINLKAGGTEFAEAETTVIKNNNINDSPGSWEPTTDQLKQVLALLSVDKTGHIVYTGGTN